MDEKAFREIREIVVELTGACTRACAFCAPGLPAGRREHPPALGRCRFFDLVDELATLQYDGTLTFCGWGEPAMHDEFEDFAADAWRRLYRARLRIFTNGDCAAKMLRALAFFDEVRVSVYEPQGWDIVLFERLVACGRHPGLRLDYHRKTPWSHVPGCYNTRAGNVRPYPPHYEARLAARRHTPCQWFQTELFLTAEGRWVTCCNDMAQVHQWKGGIAELFSNPEYLAMRVALADLAVDRRTLEPCSKCECPI